MVPTLLLLGVAFGLVLGLAFGLRVANSRRARLVVTLAALALSAAWGTAVAYNADDSDWPAALLAGTLVAIANIAVGLLVGTAIGAVITRGRVSTSA